MKLTARAFYKIGIATMSDQHQISFNKYVLVSNFILLCLASWASAEGTSEITTTTMPIGTPSIGQFAPPNTNDKETSKQLKKPQAPNEAVKPEIPATSASNESKVCTTPYCQQIAKLIRESINNTANPCTDFYEYACGSWIKKNKVPKHHTQFSRITQLSNDNEEKILEALKRNQSTDSETVMKVKNFFRSCMDEKTIGNLGKTPMLNYIDSLGSWALNDSWAAPKWDFHQVLRHIQKNFAVELFFTLDTIPDPVKMQGNKKHVILVGGVLFI